MLTYAVIITTEATGPVEVYRGTDGFKARDVYRAAVSPGMIEGTGKRRWSAWAYSPKYGYRGVDMYIVCEACGDISGIFDHYCSRCGADLD